MSTDKQESLFKNDGKKKGGRTRKRDDVHEAVRKVFFPSGISDTKSERAKMNVLVKMARARLPEGVHEAGAIAILRARKAAYRNHKTFRECACTPMAVLQRWDDLDESPEKALRGLCKTWCRATEGKGYSLPADSSERLYVYLNVMVETRGLKDRPDLAAEARREWFRLHKLLGPLASPGNEDLQAAVTKILKPLGV